MPVLQGRGRGDLVVEMMVETPTRMSREQRALLEQFRELETGEECPASRGFFDKIKNAGFQIVQGISNRIIYLHMDQYGDPAWKTPGTTMPRPRHGAHPFLYQLSRGHSCCSGAGDLK